MTEPVVKCVCGMTGAGKTTKAERLVALWPRVLYYDSIGHDYTDGVVFTDRREMETFWRRTYRGPFRMIYRPEDPEEDFGRMCHLVRECGNMAFVVDEAHLFCKGGKIIDREFVRLVGTGRHYDIDLICCSQSPRHLAEFLRSQAHEWYVFMLKEPDQIDYVVKRLGGLVAREDVQRLQRFEYLFYRDYGLAGTPDAMTCRDDLISGATHFGALDAQGDPDQHDATV